MTELALPSSSRSTAPDLARFPRHARWVVKLLQRLEHGTLTVRFPDGQTSTYGSGAPHAEIALANWNVFAAALKGGDIGFAESYLAGDWTTSDLVRLLGLFVRNRSAAEQVIYGSFWGGLARRIRHLLNRNTRSQAPKNIHAHYDLGNGFYGLWLDATMTYSSALFDDAADPHAVATTHELEAGQQRKYARVLDQLDLAPGARVLEIGCGWGGFAETAARAGHRVTGLTLSPAQLEAARMRMARAGLGATLALQDYRDETGVYDGIASIEMFEAVGESYWDAYFATLKRCLAPHGRACIQTIVIADELFERYRRSTDFIQQYIFPGGMLPSRRVFEQRAARAGLRVVDRFAFGMHYARTLATWRARFLAHVPAVRSLGFDSRFIRIWDFYLAYCEAAFAERNTDVVHVTLAHA